MTLVLSYLSKDDIIQISDRRFSNADGSEQAQGNKAVAFTGHLSFGYTGFVELYSDIAHKKVATDIWLKNTLVHACEKYPLQDKDPIWLSNILNLIATKAELALNRVRLTYPNLSLYRQAFVGVGWEVVDHSTDELRPVIVKISNFHDENGDELSETSIKFNVSWKSLPEHEAFHLDFTGVAISEENQKRIRSRFNTLHKRNKGALEKTELLIRVIYWVAEQGPSVSKDLMGVYLPKNAIVQQRSGNFGFSGGASISDFPPNATSAVGRYSPNTGGWLFANSFPPSSGVAYFHLPEGINEPIWHSPIFVDPSGFSGHVVISPVSPDDAEATPRNSQPLYERCQATVLSDWSEKYDAIFNMYERYPLLQDHYKDYEVSDISMAAVWEPNEPCPYYGVALCVKLPEVELENLHLDTRYFVITSRNNDPLEIPDVAWFERLKSWLENRHLPINELDLFLKIIRPLQRKDILDRLRLLMATPREVLSAQYRQLHGE